ncbi:hypothetical protein C1645_823065 [Glomus cerebriforme]|uniref:Tesmin/TSO1-like CXC domain-containing protein n=1 Tax=Glomus cerebriforme TaxID=658196 RepID=A0A397SXA5_9GLOM|nr:hypothetical protein C1645_823065 [Glomus cerebriforme]
MINQMNKGKKRLNYYEIEDLVRISVLKIDHFEIDPLGVKHYPELETISTNTITVREVTRLQNIGLTTGIICNCKGNCNSKKCNCKKMGNNCGSQCHGSRHCQNKHEDN